MLFCLECVGKLCPEFWTFQLKTPKIWNFPQVGKFFWILRYLKFYDSTLLASISRKVHLSWFNTKLLTPKKFGPECEMLYVIIPSAFFHPIWILELRAKRFLSSKVVVDLDSWSILFSEDIAGINSANFHHHAVWCNRHYDSIVFCFYWDNTSQNFC